MNINVGGRQKYFTIDLLLHFGKVKQQLASVFGIVMYHHEWQ